MGLEAYSVNHWPHIGWVLALTTTDRCLQVVELSRVLGLGLNLIAIRGQIARVGPLPSPKGLDPVVAVIVRRVSWASGSSGYLVCIIDSCWSD